jgi:hypothetical protein
MSSVIGDMGPGLSLELLAASTVDHGSGTDAAVSESGSGIIAHAVSFFLRGALSGQLCFECAVTTFTAG